MSRPRRFYSLDALRGIAALSVVLWHWNHFFLPHASGAHSKSDLPLFRFLLPVYEWGWFAVSLFFSLSGFIFFWLYAESVAARRTTVRRFFVLRFSRLYPLHFVTLLAVLIGQLVYHGLTSTWFVYPWNDLYHFVLNLFFASSWGFEKGFSFNAPIWSVSVEVVLYAVFFLFCRNLPVRLRVLVPLAIVAYVGLGQIYAPIGKGLGAFLMGGCAYRLYDLKAEAWAHRKFLVVAGVMLGAGWLAALGTRSDWVASLPPVLHGAYAFEALVCLGLFPATHFVLALAETARGTLGKRVAFLGNLSYSSYLLHFPLQLGLMTLTTALAIRTTVYSSPWMLALFFALLVPLSLASHRWLEMPAQRFLRKAL